MNELDVVLDDVHRVAQVVCGMGKRKLMVLALKRTDVLDRLVRLRFVFDAKEKRKLDSCAAEAGIELTYTDLGSYYPYRIRAWRRL